MAGMNRLLNKTPSSGGQHELGQRRTGIVSKKKKKTQKKTQPMTGDQTSHRYKSAGEERRSGRA